MNPIRPPLRLGLAVLALLLMAGAALAETPSTPTPSSTAADGAKPAPPVPFFSRSERYTAQRKPRAAVYRFTDTHRQATETVFSASVKAMLVTYLKRKSQFVVVERQDLGDIEQEWKLSRAGRTNLITDPASRELLETIDAVLIGTVTLLDAPSPIERTTGGGGGDSSRIEIDVKALG